MEMKEIKMKSVVHHENGDSEFEFVVKVHKACSDKHGTSVKIGNLLTMFIIDRDNVLGTQIEVNGEFLPKSFSDRHEALDWILESLGYLK